MIDPIGTAYIELGFAISQHIDGYVDAYAGPPMLRDAVLAHAPIPPNELVTRADALLEAIQSSDYPSQRRSFLIKQVRAMATACRQLAGATLDYLTEVERHFDIVPQKISDETFGAAIEELQTLLPGSGSIHARVQAWRDQFIVTPAVAQTLLDVIVPEVRQRTQSLYPLPELEYVDFRLVSNQPWSGYNWYHGDYHSTVDINTDLPLRANVLTDLVTHEAYPGHHTEHCVKEAGLFHQRGWAEHGITLLNTPECVIAEGIANVASSVLFEGRELSRWQAETLYPLAGIDNDPLLEERIGGALKVLGTIGGNVAFLLHVEGRPQTEAIQYMMQWGLAAEDRARKLVSFIADPLWRTYTFTYFYGEQLIREWLQRGDRIDRYRTLLNEQITPSLLERWVLEERNVCGVKG